VYLEQKKITKNIRLFDGFDLIALIEASVLKIYVCQIDRVKKITLKNKKTFFFNARSYLLTKPDIYKHTPTLS